MLENSEIEHGRGIKPGLTGYMLQGIKEGGAIMGRMIMAILVVIAVTCVSVPAFAADKGDEGMMVTVDVLLVRPVSLAATVVGTAIFVVSLPFTIPAGGVSKAASVLISEPFAYTFKRPIGCPEMKCEQQPAKEY